MSGLLQLPETVEALVMLVEQTPSERIVEETLDVLRAGTPPCAMLTASALGDETCTQEARRRPSEVTPYTAEGSAELVMVFPHLREPHSGTGASAAYLDRLRVVVTALDPPVETVATHVHVAPAAT